MPFDIPETHVTDNPIVILAFVVLFAGAIVAAVLLAFRYSRPPETVVLDHPEMAASTGPETLVNDLSTPTVDSDVADLDPVPLEDD